jgi:DNA-binding SARP family transcriptional activator
MTVSKGRCATATVAAPAGLRLTGEFALVVGDRRLTLPHSAERVVAYLALANRPVVRSRLSGSLWIDGSARTAAKSLRTALWRTHLAGADLIVGTADRLRLHPAVSVDVLSLADLGHRLVRHPDAAALAEVGRLLDAVELLPDWGDEWIVADRERFRLVRLEALESAAAALAERGSLGDALLVALAAVHAEPLRETARRLLIRIQLAQGNHAEAIRNYQEYVALLRTEFGVAPSPALHRLLAPLRPGGGRGR